MRLTLEETLTSLVAMKRQHEIWDTFYRQLEARAKSEAHDGKVYTYLNGFPGLLNRYREFVRRELGVVLDSQFVKELAYYMRTLDIRLELDIEYAPAPWHRWQAGNVVVVVLGFRYMQHPYARVDPTTGVVEKRMKHGTAGRQDIIAIQELTNILQTIVQIDFRLEVVFERSDLPYRQAKRLRNRLLHRNDVGCVVSLASPMTNPLADPLARFILQEDDERKRPARLPVGFHWCATPGKHLTGCVPFLSIPSACEIPDEGIYLVDGGVKGNKLASRTHDKIAMKSVREHPAAASSAGPFYDCGMLMISAREDEPVVIVAAGHGGWGTVAAVQGLADPTGTIETQLHAPKGLGEACILGVIETRLRKNSKKHQDDLYIDKDYQELCRKSPSTAWKFVA